MLTHFVMIFLKQRHNKLIESSEVQVICWFGEGRNGMKI